MIRDPDQANSSFLARALARRRPRHFVAVVLALCLLTLVWLWSSSEFEGLVVDKLPPAHQNLKDDNETTVVEEATPAGKGIPPKIWQILLPPKPEQEKALVNPEQLQDTPSWLAMNRDYL